MVSHYRKKGISPLIATVLLIVFAISIAALLLSWLGGYTAETTEKADASSASILGCTRQGVEILRVFATGSDKNITKVDVLASGLDLVVIKDVLVSTKGTTQCDLATSETTQQPGSITSYTSSSCAVNCTTIDTVRVVTSCASVTDTVTGNTTVVGC